MGSFSPWLFILCKTSQKLKKRFFSKNVKTCLQSVLRGRAPMSKNKNLEKMLELLLSLLGLLFPNQNTATISQDQNPIVIQTTTNSVDGDTGGEIGQITPKK